MQVPSCFTFYKQVTLTKVAVSSEICYYTSILHGISVASTLVVHTATLLVLLIAEN